MLDEHCESIKVIYDGSFGKFLLALRFWNRMVGTELISPIKTEILKDTLIIMGPIQLSP